MHPGCYALFHKTVRKHITMLTLSAGDGLKWDLFSYLHHSMFSFPFFFFLQPWQMVLGPLFPGIPSPALYFLFPLIWEMPLIFLSLPSPRGRGALFLQSLRLVFIWFLASSHLSLLFYGKLVKGQSCPITHIVGWWHQIPRQTEGGFQFQPWLQSWMETEKICCC